MTSVFCRKNTENDTVMPLEVDGDSDEGDPKGEGFQDEFKNKDDNNEANGPFLPKKIFPSKANCTPTSGYGIFSRKLHVLVLIIAVASVFSAIAFWGRSRKPVLRFRLDGSSGSYFPTNYSASSSFKIMQITDIHLGEAEYTDWGPKQDEKTFKLLEKIFDYEPDCDLVVLGGDQLTANNCLGNCTEYYSILGRFLSRYGVPWATIIGNHDDMAFEVGDGSGATIPHSYSRRDLLDIDRRFPLSLSQESAPGEMTGVTNYVLDVLDPVTETPALQIFFLDSGGGSLREAIDDDQIKWFREQAGVAQNETTSTTETTRTKAKLPAVAFQHIPTWQHEYVHGYCMGYQGEGVAELEYDGGIVDAMVESGRFHFLAVGHNHGNDYCCPYYDNYDDDNDDDNTDDLYFCFGRHSGYGGYGKLERGVRIYELALTSNEKYDDNVYKEGDDIEKDLKWRTWVRLESGDMIDLLDFDHMVDNDDDD